MTSPETNGVLLQPHSNSFSQLLPLLAAGETQNEASEKLTRLIEAVSIHAKPGKLCFMLTVEPASRGTACNFSVDITVKMPKTPADQTLMFVDPDQGFVLSKTNPRQREFPYTQRASLTNAEPIEVEPTNQESKP